MLNRGTRLDRLDLESSANIGEHRGTEGQRLWVMLLPSLIFRSEVKCARVLQIGGQHNGFVAGLSRKLNTKVPSVKGDKNEVEILGGQVLGGKRIESRDSVSKGTCISNMLPSKGRQTRYRGSLY